MEDYSTNKVNFVQIVTPVCSCGNELGKLQYFFEYERMVRGKETTDILDKFGLTRVCCRSGFITPGLTFFTSGHNRSKLELEEISSVITVTKIYPPPRIICDHEVE